MLCINHRNLHKLSKVRIIDINYAKTSKIQKMAK